MLGPVGRKGLLGHLKSREAAIAVQGRLHLQGDPAHALRQVLIDLLHGPGPVPLRGGRVIGRVRRQRHGVQGRLGREDVLPVAVLPVHVLGHHHQRPDPAIEPDQGQGDLLRLEPVLQPLHGVLGHVGEAQQIGLVLKAPQIQTVETLVGPSPAGQRDQGHGAGIAPLAAVKGIHAPQEHPFVVGMGGDDQKIHLVRRRQQPVRPLRQGARTIDVKLRKPQRPAQRTDGHGPAAAHQGHPQRHGAGAEDPHPKGQARPSPLKQQKGGV